MMRTEQSSPAFPTWRQAASEPKSVRVPKSVRGHVRPATRRLGPVRSSLTLLVVASCLAWVGCSKPKLVLNEAAQHFVAARAALEAGDKAKALTELDAAIAAGPDVWMYYERGKLHAEEGRDDQAKADCAAGLALDAEHPDLLWLQGELKKPKGRRFKGKTAEPPMGSK